MADASELDFSRYGDTLFEVAFVGARLTTGGSVATEGKKLDINVRGCLLLVAFFPSDFVAAGL